MILYHRGLIRTREALMLEHWTTDKAAGHLGLLLATIALIALPACQKKASESRSADEIYTQRCARCHGTEGRGDGPAAASLGARPRDFTAPTWQAGRDDRRIAKAIVEGGEAVGVSALMPPHPDLRDRSIELVAHIRALGTPMSATPTTR